MIYNITQCLMLSGDLLEPRLYSVGNTTSVEAVG